MDSLSQLSFKPRDSIWFNTITHEKIQDNWIKYFYQNQWIKPQLIISPHSA